MSATPRYRDGIGVERCARRFHTTCGGHMRLFDDDHIGCYLDDIGHRVEKTKDGKELRTVDLTLRVQPLTAELAKALDPDVRALLFNLSDALPKHKVKAVHFALAVPRQALTVRLMPEVDDAALHISDVEITDVRARVEKGVDGYALVFYASFGPVGARDLEYLCTWHTQQRFVTFQPQEPGLDFAGAAEANTASPRRGRRATAIATGDEIRPGVHAQH
jgi:hypothetical protein